ncbi:MAG: TatD family hydrolase [Candidatus Competibacter sp.]|nr:TatD family hydrolase [Candidatus Competibacter sp.]MDG4585390.1 TatD family hydrolase [Candidatus Competibacter sp.]
MPILIDSHAHFDDASFDGDRDAAYQRARAVGVEAQVLAAVCARLWPKLRAVAARYPGLYPSYGLHPAYLTEHRPEHLDALADWVVREKPAAIGEIGLDYYLPDLDIGAQVDYFTGQLRLARRHDLPVIVHARHAVDQVIKHLRRFSGVRGVVHSFSGSEDQARRLLDLDFLLGFGGPLTYPRATRLRGLIRYLPLDGFMLETDAPDQPTSAHPGQRNEPAFLPEVLACVAELRGVDPAEIAAATSANARRLFGIPDAVPSGTD